VKWRKRRREAERRLAVLDRIEAEGRLAHAERMAKINHMISLLDDELARRGHNLDT
jgi:hypothetical protein